ncbi:hypothetical protein AAFF_G00096250 [Aldrovandia affinis]|uniref:Secreted protein n=1 Tax=Aldrovandia affinis TaxID=143900 RepID=A0AAD7WBN2_9TELE|nr:hypothetical protein AAFF_G00096250 [Aldrovandia affinis]
MQLSLIALLSLSSLKSHIIGAPESVCHATAHSPPTPPMTGPSAQSPRNLPRLHGNGVKELPLPPPPLISAAGLRHSRVRKHGDTPQLQHHSRLLGQPVTPEAASVPCPVLSGSQNLILDSLADLSRC